MHAFGPRRLMQIVRILIGKCPFFLFLNKNSPLFSVSFLIASADNLIVPADAIRMSTDSLIVFTDSLIGRGGRVGLI